MVYVRLSAQIYSKLSTLLPPNSFTMIKQQPYISYPMFKQIAHQHNLSLHQSLKGSDLIMYAEMDKLIQEARRSPQQKRLIEELKAKHELRMLNVKGRKGEQSNYYFQNKKDRSIKEMTDSASFGMTFIFSFFMAGLTGYYFAEYVLGLQFSMRMMVAMFFIIGTIIVETTLYIIKQSRNQSKPNPKSIPKSNKNSKQKGKNKVQ